MSSGKCKSTAGSLNYSFQPFKLVKVDYKCYDGLFDRGINVYPKPRSGHRIACTDSDIFCFGGFNPTTAQGATNTLFKELWRFNLFTKKWQLVFGQRNDPNTSYMPIELVSNALCMTNDTIVVHGGTGFPFGDFCSNKTYIISPYTNPKYLFQLETTGSEPLPLYGQSIVIIDKYLYTIGGTTGYQYSCDVHRLDLNTKEWKSLFLSYESPEEPPGRYRHEIVHDEHFIYVLGGGTSSEVYSLSELPAFCLATNKWQTIQTKPDPLAVVPGFPENRRCHTTVQYTSIDGHVEVAISGGYFNEQSFFNDIWVLNLSTLRWRFFQTARLPHPMYFHDAATSGNGLMYLFGGIESHSSGSQRTNNIFKIWVTIPKLSEICWEALTTMVPRMPLFPVRSLLAAGVPKRFVDRLHRSKELT